MATIKQLRKEKRWTLSHFCETTGIPANRLSGIERGKIPASLEEKLLIERYLGLFEVDVYDGSGSGLPLPTSLAKVQFGQELIAAGVETQADLENHLEAEADELRQLKVNSYYEPAISHDLYDRFISATDQSRLKDDQKQRIAELKIAALDLANNIARKCPPGRLRTKALTDLEATMDWALKSITLEF